MDQYLVLPKIIYGCLYNFLAEKSAAISVSKVVHQIVPLMFPQKISEVFAIRFADRRSCGKPRARLVWSVERQPHVPSVLSRSLSLDELRSSMTPESPKGDPLPVELRRVNEI